MDHSSPALPARLLNFYQLALTLLGLLILTNAEALTPSPGFSKKHGFQSAPFNLALSAPAKGGTLRYTLDGSEPTPESGTLYRSAIPIRKTSVVRAIWISPQGESSLIETRTYLFVADILNQSPTGTPPPNWPASWGPNTVDYGMDPRITQSVAFKKLIGPALNSLPSLSIVLPLESLFDPNTGIYANSGYRGAEWERHASIELIPPNGGEGFCARGGLKIRGQYSRTVNNPKHSFRFYFREEYGQPELNYPLFGPTGSASFDKFDLRCDQVNSWHLTGEANCDFIRDQWARNTMLAMGNPADRGNFYHLYLNGMYWGLYNTQEKHDAAYAASYFGGDEEDYDVVKYDNNSRETSETDGTFGSWRRLRDLAAAGLTTLAAYERIQGNDPDGTRNPAYERLLDVDNLIDYMLLGIYFAANDSPPTGGIQNNWAAFRSRKNDFGYRFFPHDWELGLRDSIDQVLYANPSPESIQSQPASGTNPWHLWEALRPNPEFRLRVADHIQKYFFQGGLLTPLKAATRYKELMDTISLAVVAESARWGDSAFKNGGGGGGGWGGEAPIQPGILTQADWIKTTQGYYLETYFPQRSQIVLDQLRAANLFPELQAPLLTPRSRPLLPGQKMMLQHPNPSATLYYTLDGSDPRLPGGSVSPSALTYSAAFLPPSASHLKARAKLDSEWSPLVEASFLSSRDISGLRITEIHYHSKATSGVPEDEAEFLELKNISPTPLSLGGLKFTAGITFQFPPSTVLAPGQFYLLARNPENFALAYPGKRASAQYEGRLSNSGDELVLSDSDGTPLLSLDYGSTSPWPVSPDGLGFSLVWSGNGNPQKAKNWRPSSLLGGSPGADDPTPPLFPKIFLVSASPRSSSGTDSVSLKNEGSQPADISGWWLSNDASNPNGIRLPSGSVLEPGQTLSISLPLNERGGKILLGSAASNGALTGYAHLFSYGPCALDDLCERKISSTGDELFTGPNPSGIQIHEIHYHPNNAPEFVELRNTSETPVDLSAWSLTGLPFTFPQGTSIPPGGFLIVSSVTPDSFRAAYSIPEECQVFGPATALLGNSDHTVQLLQPLLFGAETLSRIVESVHYEDSAPWPYSADGREDSLQRTARIAPGSDPAAWAASAPTPGAQNTVNAPPLISLVSPTANFKAVRGQSLTLLAEASDPEGSIREVRFFANADPIGAVSSAPFTVSWTPTTGKILDLYAEAEDSAGTVSRTPIHTIDLGVPPQSGTGLLATYFSNFDFSGTSVSRPESSLDNDWADQDPVPGQILRDRFSVRWTGSFLPEVSGESRFTITFSGGFKVKVDGTVVAERQPGTDSAEFTFFSVAGAPQSLEIEYSTGESPNGLSKPPFFSIRYTTPPEVGDGGGGIIQVPPFNGPMLGKKGLPSPGQTGPLSSSALYLPGINPLVFAFQTSERLPHATQSKPYFLKLDTCRGSAPIRFHSSSLPQGLALSEDGRITGSPVSSGPIQFTVSASDATGALATRMFSLLILPVKTPALPSLVLGSPSNNADYPQNPVSVSGSVNSPLGVSKLEYRLNGQPWRSITPTNSTSFAFSILLDQRRGLQIGANELQLRATDTAQRTVPIFSRQFTYSPRALLTVQVEGTGTVTRGFLGQTERVLGKTYSLTATPGPDYLFLGWMNQSLEWVSSQLRYDFRFEFEQTLTAVFTPSPFIDSAGSYLGFLSSQDPMPEGRGDLTLQITRVGSLSGKLRLGNLTFPIRGAFDNGRKFRQSLGSGKVDLQLQLPPESTSISATLTLHLVEFAVDLTGTLSRPRTGTPPAGRKAWSLSIPGSDIPNTPTQSASASLSFDSNYRARIVGRLADGTAWSLASQLLENFQLPAFSVLYNNKGQFSGSWNLPDDQTSATGSFLWHRPPQPKSHFSSGFVLLPEVTATLP